MNSFQGTVNSSQGAILKVICYHICSCQGALSEAKPIWEPGNPGRFSGRIFLSCYMMKLKRVHSYVEFFQCQGKLTETFFLCPVSLWPSFPSHLLDSKCKKHLKNVWGSDFPHTSWGRVKPKTILRHKVQAPSWMWLRRTGVRGERNSSGAEHPGSFASPPCYQLLTPRKLRSWLGWAGHGGQERRQGPSPCFPPSAHIIRAAATHPPRKTPGESRL